MILEFKNINELKKAIEEKKQELEISVDLGLNKAKIKIEGNTVIFPDGNKLNFSKIKRTDEKSCYLVYKNKLVKIQTFSKETNKYYKLVPTKDWPTVTISGVPMHQNTRVTPKEDVIKKTRFNIKGKVLDTCTGLGYTAILASKKADKVITLEYDDNILEIAKLNPYSRDLFNNKNIEILRGDIKRVIKQFKNNEFDAIIHDPPTFKLAGELYGREFYKQLYRVLKNDGELFHYTGRVGIWKGRRFIDEVIKRLKEVGF
ncbi:MAG: methyltransferase domain-containing protein, partial [Nanoarchaeota archaeon]